MELSVPPHDVDVSEAVPALDDIHDMLVGSCAFGLLSYNLKFHLPVIALDVANMPHVLLSRHCPRWALYACIHACVVVGWCLVCLEPWLDISDIAGALALLHRSLSVTLGCLLISHRFSKLVVVIIVHRLSSVIWIEVR